MTFHELCYFQMQKIVLIKVFSYITEADIVCCCKNIEMNYTINNQRSLILLSQSTHINQSYTVQCFINANNLFYSFCFSASYRAKLELQIYERDYFHNNFDTLKDIRCFSLSLLIFINDFDIYHNMYKSLISFYLQIAILSFNDYM